MSKQTSLIHILRLNNSETDHKLCISGDGGNAISLIIGFTVGGAVLVLGVVAFFLWKRKTLLTQKGKAQQKGNKKSNAGTSKKQMSLVIVVSISLASVMIIVSSISWFLIWKKKRIGGNQTDNPISISVSKEQEDDIDLPLAWKLWNEGRALELVDEVVQNEVPDSEGLRCIQVGLLCVQQRPEERPIMPSVLLMLDSDTVSLSQPGRPGFYAERSLSETDSSSLGKLISNEITVTFIEGR
ncbi:hypothetical protein Patl1_10947 [Pistacia atlantica]|uniref:Uncharacterized protein n=1 Tax=Pistacia atlantica TaxID=434234 RepID=A0ACC1A472_9ROSI|nr:hypothetical protein Patl1_10947 [Pistacia atlantica]